jgi:hypothetical protein
MCSTGAFVALIFISAAAGFSPPDYKVPSYKQSDKVLHFTAFFLITLTFYWILECYSLRLRCARWVWDV